MKLKISILFVLIFALVISLVPLTGNAAGVEGIVSLGVGTLVSNGEKPSLVKIAGFDIPFVTKKDNYELVTEVTYAYADRSFDNVSEIEAYRGLVVGRKRIFDEKLYAGIGAGGWNISNSDGENYILQTYNFQLGGKWLIEYTAGIDWLMRSGNDLYCPYIQLRLINI